MPPPRRTFIIAHVDHPHAYIYAENVREYLDGAGVPHKTLITKGTGQAPELREALSGDAFGILGFDTHLDQCWLDSTPFLKAAQQAQVPVIQWIVDHPSARIGAFDRSTGENSRFLFSSANAERYFNAYGIPGALTATVACVGPNRASRAESLTFESFKQRPIAAMVMMNLRRLGGTLDHARERVAALGEPLGTIVREAVEAAYADTVQPLEFHFDRALAAAGLNVPNPTRHAAMQALEEIVQIRRRQKIFSVAREFPILIQSDAASRPFQEGARARFEENVDVALTWSRLKQSRAQVSISNMHDMVHDRVLNGLNAGCLNIVEDSFANRRAFASGRNALFFRYDDDSLRECLELACHDVDRAYAIAAAGFALRDRKPFRFGGFENILRLTQKPWRVRLHGGLETALNALKFGR